MAEGVWADVLGDAGLLRELLDEVENHDARNVLAPSCQEEIIFEAGLYSPVVAVLKPIADFLDGTGGNRHQPLLVALAGYFDKTFVKIQVGQLQGAKLADAEATAVQCLQDGPVALPLGFAQVNGRDDGIDFPYGEHFGQLEAYFGTFEQFARIGLQVVGQDKKVEEGLDAGQNACLRARMYADVVQARGKSLQIVEGDVEDASSFAFQEMQQFIQVSLICVDRILRESLFELQVLLVFPDNQLLLFLIPCFFFCFHFFFLPLHLEIVSFAGKDKKKTDMWIQIINGPNINLLGKREPSIYGKVSFDDCLAELCAKYPEVRIDYFQSNIEGELIDKIQQAGFEADGIILNAGAYTHTSIALQDAIRAVKSPVVEVHISNVHAREAFRHVSMISGACLGVICGFGLNSYRLALEALLDYKKETGKSE